MTKRNGFRSLSKAEEDIAIKVLNREGSAGKESIFKKMRLCYASDVDFKFTTCLLRPETQKNTVYVGNSKRMTYGQNCDLPNRKVGNDVALGRALRNYVNDRCAIYL